MTLLEPYIFKVKPTRQAAEYMPQQFVFQTDRRKLTAVVARTIFGPIPEERVVLAVDVSGSMQGYISDVKAALNLALVQQFSGSSKQFNIITFTDMQEQFRPDFVDCEPEALEDAMQFVETIEAGGSSGLVPSLSRIFRLGSFDAVYVVTDGKFGVGDEFLAHLRSLYFGPPSRPKVHTIGINLAPARITWRGLEAAASLTKGSFRPVSLEPEVLDPISGPSRKRSKEIAALATGTAAGRQGVDLEPAGPQAMTTDEEFLEATTDAAEGDVEVATKELAERKRRCGAHGRQRRRARRRARRRHSR